MSIDASGAEIEVLHRHLFEGDAMAVDTTALESTFGVTLTSVANHIKSWS